jgi:hypothetical protein
MRGSPPRWPARVRWTGWRGGSGGARRGPAARRRLKRGTLGAGDEAIELGGSDTAGVATPWPYVASRLPASLPRRTSWQIRLTNRMRQGRCRSPAASRREPVARTAWRRGESTTRSPWHSARRRSSAPSREHVAGDLFDELTEEAADTYHPSTLRFCLCRLGSGYSEPERRVDCNLISRQVLAKSEPLWILRFPILDKSGSPFTLPTHTPGCLLLQ